MTDADGWKYEMTERGFGRYEFRDDYGELCSLQESSNAEREAVWLGCDRGTHAAGEVCIARMHLTVPMVERLVEELNAWLSSGRVKP